MIKKLNAGGNSRVLTITKEMLQHLKVTDEVDVQFVDEGILLKRPDSEAKRFAREFSKKYDKAMRRLAQ
jgi:antitoxin component of MazEF toxin-antitoxin module